MFIIKKMKMPEFEFYEKRIVEIKPRSVQIRIFCISIHKLFGNV